MYRSSPSVAFSVESGETLFPGGREANYLMASSERLFLFINRFSCRRFYEELIERDDDGFLSISQSNITKVVSSFFVLREGNEAHTSNSAVSSRSNRIRSGIIIATKGFPKGFAAMRFVLRVSLLAAACLIDGSDAKRRRAFPSFQAETSDVLSSINGGEYSQIYATYHRCVWSEYGAGCGGGGEGGDYWYMGNTECYRANVAYSLYGVKAGEDAPKNPCQKRHYINSFFTSDGVETFGGSLGLASYGDASSACTVSEDQQDDNGGDNNNNGDGGSTHNSMLYPNAKSYTTYCKAGKFVTALFDGAQCTGTNKELEVLAWLDDLNGEIDNVGCNLVYDATAERRLEEEQDGYDGGGREGVWNLLAYSDTCSLLQYPKGCPNLYGAKSSFDMNPRRSSSPIRQMAWYDWLTFVVFVLGCALLGMSCCVRDRRVAGADERDGIIRSGRGSGPLGRSLARQRSRSRERSTSREQSIPKSDGAATGTDGTTKKKGLFRGFFSRRNK